MQIPDHTKEFCRECGTEQATTADSSARTIRTLPLPVDAEVIVRGITA